MTERADSERRVRLGTIVGMHGVSGWLKLFSYTEPRQEILRYRPLIVAGEPVAEFEGKTQGKALLLRLVGLETRTQAETLVGAAVEVLRSQLPQLTAGEYYWSDLEGLRVMGHDGYEFGTVQRLLPTGANDVMVVQGDREYLIPFVQPRYVLEVDLERRRMVVDWAADYL